LKHFIKYLTKAPLLWALIFISTVSAKDKYFPNPTGFVNDYAGILKKNQLYALENLCKEAKEKANIEIAIILMETIPDNQAISSYTVELGHHWGVGGKGADRGAVLLYKTGRTGVKRDIYLATGYGLEGFIPDAKAGRILDEITVPLLKKNDVVNALGSTISTIVGIVEPEVRLTGAPEPRKVSDNSRERSGSRRGPGFILMLFILMALFGPRGFRGLFFGMLLGSAMGGRGSWGSGGGGFGGGFGGFGGGGFGGGGAGRSF